MMDDPLQLLAQRRANAVTHRVAPHFVGCDDFGTNYGNRWISRFNPLTLIALCCACLASGPASAQDSDEYQTHLTPIVIRPGDTLSHIALREMGDAERARELADSNGLPIDKILKPGDSINVPVSLPVRDEAASIIFHKGEVTLNGEDIKADDRVRRNDTIETGQTGYVSLEFQTGTVINVQPNSQTTLVTLHCQRSDDTCIIEMATARGALSTDVRRDGEQPTDFRVRTPYASAAVRGTVFDVGTDESGLRIGVTEGAVAVGAADGDQMVDLDIGFGSVAAPGTPISSPIALLPAPVFRFVPTRITRNDRVRWFGLTDVADYLVQIAAQPSGVGVLYEDTVDTDSFNFEDDLPSGDYHLLLRPVDDNGLLGFTASSPITVADTDTSIDPVDVSVEQENGNYRIEIVEAPDDAAGYEIQVATDADFSDPVSVDIDTQGVALVRLPGDTIFARARVLVDRITVGPYGDATTIEQ